jgi:hypothetical protein
MTLFRIVGIVAMLAGIAFVISSPSTITNENAGVGSINVTRLGLGILLLLAGLFAAIFRGPQRQK